MAGVALLARVSPSVASTGDVGGGRREMALMSSNARAEYPGDFSHHLKRPSVSQLSCCTSSYIQLRGREKRVMQLTMSSSQHVLNGSSARLAVAHAGSLSERIASSQFCSCSSNSSNSSRGSGGLGGSSSPGLHNREIVEGLLRHWFLSKSSKRTTRRKVAAAAVSADGFKQIYLPGSQLGSCWSRKRAEGVPPMAAGPGQPLSENWDVGDFRMDTSFGMDDGDVSLGDASLGDASMGDALPGGVSMDEDLKFTDLVATRIADGTNGASSQVSRNEDKQEVDSITSESPSSSSSSSEGGWISKRWAIVILCFFAFLLCNMDRVNMSIAILPMSAEYHWNSTTVGLVQSSFFWGYLLTQVAGGVWADSIGGKQVLGFGVIWWSLATVATPIAAKIGLPALFFVRACMGIGEGVAMPAMNNLLSKWIPVGERSRSLALVYSGMYLGSVIGLGCSPTLIHKLGWPSVFFCFGSVGAIWFAIWQRFAYSSPAEDPTLSKAESELILKSNKPNKGITRIPWGLILSKAPVWALIVCHFCHNWGTFILLTWMPTYYHQVLGFNLTESGLFSVLPWLTMAISANVGGWIADTLVSKGYSITLVRKVMQSIGFLGPAFFLTQLSHITSPYWAVACMMASQGSDAFSQAGLYSNHQDIGPRYSGILLGLSNTAGVLAGVFGTAATGYILQHGSWDDVFKVAVGLYLFGTVIWNLFSTGEQLFD